MDTESDADSDATLEAEESEEESRKNELIRRRKTNKQAWKHAVSLVSAKNRKFKGESEQTTDDITTKHIKELLLRLAPAISASGSSENTPQILMFLPDTDPNFHTLEIVKRMRAEIREELTESIENIIDDCIENDFDDENPPSTILNTLFQQDTFQVFMNKFQNNLMDSCEMLHQNFDKEIGSVLMNYHLTRNFKGNNLNTDSSSNLSSLNSSLNQTGFIFLSSMQYESIAATLKNEQMIEQWIESLNSLLEVSPSEPVEQNSWNDLKKGLRNTLHVELDEGQPKTLEIFNKSLQIHSKLLSSQNQVAVTEAVSNLIKALSDYWFYKRLLTSIPSYVNNSICYEKSYSIFAIAKLLLAFMKELPFLWVRYSENKVDELVDQWLTFLSFKSENEKYLSVTDVFAILDPECRWASIWLHSSYSRSHVFKSLTRNTTLLTSAIRTCLDGCNENQSKRPPENFAQENDIEMQAELVYIIRYRYNLNLLVEIIQYSEGMALFPIKLQSYAVPISLPEIFSKLYSTRLINSDKHTFISFMEKILEFQRQYCKVSSSFLCDIGMHSKYIMDLDSNLENLSETYINYILKSLDSLLSCDIGISYISWDNSFSTKPLLQNLENCTRMLDALETILADEYQHEENKSIAMLIVNSILNNFPGFLLYAKHPIYRSIIGKLDNLNHPK